MSFFQKISEKARINPQSNNQSQLSSSSQPAGEDLGKSNHGVPDIVMKTVDRYVDSIQPTLIPKLEAEIASFQSKTLDSLDRHLKEAFHSIFLGGFSSLGSESRRREIAPNSFSENNLNDEKDQNPSDYGQLGLPFAALTDDLADILTEAFDPLKNADPEAREAYLRRDAAHQAELNRSEQSGNLFSIALDKVSAFAESSQSQMGFGETPSQSSKLDVAAARLSKLNIGRTNQHTDLGGWLKRIIKDVHGDDTDAETKMREITPELKEKIGALLSHTHKPLATAFTTLSLTQLKRWLRGHISARDLGSEGKAELVQKLDKLTSSFFKKREGSSRAAPSTVEDAESSCSSSDEEGPPASSRTQTQQDTTTTRSTFTSDATSNLNTSSMTSSTLAQPQKQHSKSHGLSAIVSRKLTEGLTNVRVETRDDFRRILAKIEGVLFEALPDCLQGPLSILFGGNPFENNGTSSSNPNPQKSRSVSSFSSKLSAILSVDISSLLAPILQGLQRALRARLMELVGGGHRFLESKTWDHVQQAVVQKVSKYIKGVEVNIGESLEEKKSRHHRENEQIKLEGLKDWDWEKGNSFGPVKEEEKTKVQQSLNEIVKTGEAASFYDGSYHSTSNQNADPARSQSQSQSQPQPQPDPQSRPGSQAAYQNQAPFQVPTQPGPISQSQASESFAFPMPDHQRSVGANSSSEGGFSMPQPEHYQR